MHRECTCKTEIPPLILCQRLINERSPSNAQPSCYHHFFCHLTLLHERPYQGLALVLNPTLQRCRCFWHLHHRVFMLITNGHLLCSKRCHRRLHSKNMRVGSFFTQSSLSSSNIVGAGTNSGVGAGVNIIISIIGSGGGSVQVSVRESASTSSLPMVQEMAGAWVQHLLGSIESGVGWGMCAVPPCPLGHFTKSRVLAFLCVGQKY